MSTTYKISQLRDLFNDWETGLDQAVTLLPSGNAAALSVCNSPFSRPS